MTVHWAAGKASTPGVCGGAATAAGGGAGGGTVCSVSEALRARQSWAGVAAHAHAGWAVGAKWLRNSSGSTSMGSTAACGAAAIAAVVAAAAAAAAAGKIGDSHNRRRAIQAPC